MMPSPSCGDSPNLPEHSPLGNREESGTRVRNLQESDSPEKSLGWSAVAARITAWTSRLLISFLIIAAALVFTSQILRWWRTPEPLPVTATNSPDNDTWNAVEWADADWTTTLYTASGPEEEVAADLARRMLRATQEAAVPADRPNEQELAVLRRLADRKPFLKDEQGAAVYRLNQSLPIWLGMRSDDKVAPPESRQPRGFASTGNTDDAQLRKVKAARIVAWGFLVPMDGELWRIALAVSGSNPAGRRSAGEIPLPTGAEPGFTIRFGDGTMLQAFRGERADKSAWMAHFDAWLGSRGWSAGTKWQVRNDEAVRHYRRRDPSPDSAASEFLFVTLRDEAGTTRGFLMRESSTNDPVGSDDGGAQESGPP
ncbi:MAG: hypothetical protein GYA33_01465 [Thermogutta sp.]|nr:hypothetical protein [Thermogutta sp.]